MGGKSVHHSHSGKNCSAFDRTTQSLTLDLRVWGSAKSFWVLILTTELGSKLDKVWGALLGAGGSGVGMTAERKVRIHTVLITLTSQQGDLRQPLQLPDPQASICGVEIPAGLLLGLV